MKKRKFLRCFWLLATLTLPAATQAQSDMDAAAISFGASYVGDVVGNMSGGIRTAAAYLGMANISLSFDTKMLGLWRGGTFFINGTSTHGGEPTATLIGDFQTASNIEAGNHTYLYELWYRQNLGQVSFIIGLQDFNAEFCAVDNGGLFINSYFGIHSVCSDNVLVPIFPSTGLGANITWNISDSWRLAAAVFDGEPDNFDVNPYNVKWSFSPAQGILGAIEVQANKSLIRGRNASYKLGGYLHRHTESGAVVRDYGLYLLGDQEITNMLSAFIQVGISPKSLNDHYLCWGGGLTLGNFIASRTEDKIGLAMNYAHFNSNITGNECVIEAFYSLQLTENIYFKPDLQYIINPAGTGQKLKNALVGIFRFGVDF